MSDQRVSLLRMPGNLLDRVLALEKALASLQRAAHSGRTLIFVGEAYVAWDPANLASGASTYQAVAVSGVLFDDVIFADHDQLTKNTEIFLVGRWNGNDSVLVILTNQSAGAVNVASGTLTVQVWRKSPALAAADT